MSFAADVKDELCRVSLEKPCCVRSELYGCLLFGNTFSSEKIKLVTEHDGFAKRLGVLLDAAFSFSWDRAENRSKWVLALTDSSKCSVLWDAYCYGQRQALHLNNAVLECDSCTPAFWRGAFLSGGTMADPEKEYHLQLSTTHFHLVRELEALFLDCSLETKIASRDGVYALYFKASESIEDFLTLTGATRSALSLMQAKVEKDLRNTVNRKVNCDTANLSKTVQAAMEQGEVFRRLRASHKWDSLPESLRQTVELRLQYPEHSLTELAAAFDPPIGRSALNHRLRKLIKLAKTL